ncbi:MAG: pilus assembly protein TadG-related protein, partial [Vicinamibacterales bacterium]
MRLTDRGAITIHVALGLMAILAFAAMVVDQGVMYVARRQAQNAADAGALAGAISLMYDANARPEATIAARTMAAENAVWGQATAAADVIVSPLPYNCPDGVPSCIRVDVLRGQPDRAGTAHSNTIPTYMMRMLGTTTQGVRATATAQIAAGNAVECIKPWVVADKWTDGSGTGSNTAGWDQEDSYQVGTDSYSLVNGFSAATDTGTRLMLKGDGRDFSSGWTLEIDLNGGNGGNVYRDEIRTCPTWVPTVGLYKPGTTCDGPTDTDPEKGCLNVKTGVKQGPTEQGVADLIAYDPGATWDAGTSSVTGGCTAAGTCATANPLGIPISPRIVPIAIFDPGTYAASGFNGNGGMARVVNLLGFFVEGMCSDVYATPPAWCGTGADPSKTVVGRLMPYPGQASGASGSAGPNTFLKITR